MAAFASTSTCSRALPAIIPKPKLHVSQRKTFSLVGGPMSKNFPRIQISKKTNKYFPRSKCSAMTSSSVQPDETLKIVQSTISKQLSIDESTVTPETKFSDLGADSLDTVEIMMALEEQFGVSIGEGGAENITTVQDAADLIDKVKAAKT